MTSRIRQSSREVVLWYPRLACVASRRKVARMADGAHRSRVGPDVQALADRCSDGGTDPWGRRDVMIAYLSAPGAGLCPVSTALESA
jgi:hypothetical protein